MKMKILLALACLEKDFRVVKSKNLPTIRIYFDGFLTGAVLSLLCDIEGLHIVGINCEERYILTIY